MIEITCSECGKKKLLKPSVLKFGGGKTCSLPCKAKRRSRLYVGGKAPCWKGGKRITSKGYVTIYSFGHPRSHDNHVFEHIIVAEKALGRPLPRGTPVHHLDENKANNANTNLVICQDEFYHNLLHERKNVFDAGGHPGTDFICLKCKKVWPKTEKMSRYCKECTVIYNHSKLQKEKLKCQIH